MNKVIIVGNLGADPEVRYTQSEKAVANFSVATNESWTNKEGERQERTEWHRIVVWGRQAETCQEFLSKGSKVAIEGKIQTRKWETEEGETRYSTEIVANRVEFLSTRQDGGGGSGKQDYDDDDIPF